MASLFSRPRKGELQLCGGSGKLHLLSRAAVRRMISFKQDFCGLRMVIAPLSSAIVEAISFSHRNRAFAKHRYVRTLPRAESIGTMSIRTILTTTAPILT